MPSLTVENYVKEIYKLCTHNPEQLVTTGQLAGVMNVSPGTVTSMLKGLSEDGLVSYTPYEGVKLTHKGDNLALRVLRRHRLIETFLTRVLDLDWDQVHDDAEQMEHVVSDILIDRMSDYLGNPQFDPHGDPIPGPDGIVAERQTCELLDCPTGSCFNLAQVTDQSPGFLRYLRQSGLSPGQEGKVLANPSEEGSIEVEVDGRVTMLDLEAARRLRVTLSSVPSVQTME